MSIVAIRMSAFVNQLMNVHGLTAAAASGIAGNVAVESPKFDHTQKQFGGGPGRGLFQFEGGHLKAYNEFLSRNFLRDSMENQVKYVMENINNGVGFDIGAGNRKILQDAFKNGGP